jgi:AcrR family transcriptional regulator
MRLMSHKEVPMNSQDRSFERVNQKRRTRGELVRAARELIERGQQPSVAEVADHANISRATAYRYFSAPEELIREAVLDAVANTINVAPLPAGAGARQVEKGLDKLVVDVFSMVVANEGVFRTLLASHPSNSPSRRGGRRVTWLTEALAPLDARLPPLHMKRLVHALSLLTGIEALVVMRDVCELSPKEGEKVLRWAAQTLLSGALIETESKQPKRGKAE